MRALVAAALLPLASAHFLLTWPAARGFSDDQAGSFPCGGFNDVSSNRTAWPLAGGPVQLDMHHTMSKVQVLLALGNDPGSSFSYVLVPTLQERGPKDFCLGFVPVPADLNITDGTNATLQVVTNGDPSGGLYQCADITFSSSALYSDAFSAHCSNSSGVSVELLSNAGNANGSSSSSATASASSGSAASATSKGLAAQATLASWALGAMGVVGGLVAL